MFRWIPTNPRQRLELILEDCQARGVAYPAKFCGRCVAGKVATVFLDEACWKRTGRTDESMASRALTRGGSGLHPLHFGLHGRAERVCRLAHRNLVVTPRQARLSYYKDSPERFLLLSSYAFDSSVAGIFHTLVQVGRW